MSASPLSALEFVVLGTGSMATALATALVSHAGARSLRIWGRASDRAQELCRRLPAAKLRGEPVPELERALSGADVLLLCVADNALEELAHAAAEALPVAKADAVALHLSGYASPERLAPLRQSGWKVGQLHPLVSIARQPSETAECTHPFAQVYFALGGDDQARALGSTLAKALDGRTIELAAKESARALYHGAASLMSGGLVALFDGAERMLAASVNSDPRESRAALLELLRSTLRNLEHGQSFESLTGPVSRGDLETVRGHLRALSQDTHPELQELEPLYRRVSLAIVELARRRGALDAQELAALQTLLQASLPTP